MPAAQRFALPALGRAAERRPTGKMLRRREMLGIAPESPASGARFVRRVYKIITFTLGVIQSEISNLVRLDIVLPIQALMSACLS